MIGVNLIPKGYWQGLGEGSIIADFYRCPSIVCVCGARELAGQWKRGKKKTRQYKCRSLNCLNVTKYHTKHYFFFRVFAHAYILCCFLLCYCFSMWQMCEIFGLKGTKLLAWAVVKTMLSPGLHCCFSNMVKWTVLIKCRKCFPAPSRYSEVFSIGLSFTHSHTFIRHWVAAATQGAANPIGNN